MNTQWYDVVGIRGRVVCDSWSTSCGDVWSGPLKGRPDHVPRSRADHVQEIGMTGFAIQGDAQHDA